MKNGFTFLEVISAIFIIVVGVGGAVTLTNQIIQFTQLASSKLVASYLALEGIEIVKNIRDTNFLEIRKTGAEDWLNGLEICDAGCEGDYTTTDSLSVCPDPCDDNLRFLGIDGDGLYGYNYFPGNETIFKRKITTSPSVWPKLQVLVEVSWQERGRTHTVTAEEHLYDWW